MAPDEAALLTAGHDSWPANQVLELTPDEVQQLVQSALHAEGRPRAHATVAQLLVESHPRFGGGEVACGCVTVADLSGWDLARPGDALQASSTRSATDGAAVGANRALHALAGCVDALAASSRRSAALGHAAAAEL